MPCLRTYLYGKVQGVSFRYYIMKEAQRLGLMGWVKNLEDGSVEVHAQGGEEAIQQLLRHCRKGPPYSEIQKVETNETREDPSLIGFEIRY